MENCQPSASFRPDSCYCALESLQIGFIALGLQTKAITITMLCMNAGERSMQDMSLPHSALRLLQQSHWESEAWLCWTMAAKVKACTSTLWSWPSAMHQERGISGHHQHLVRFRYKQQWDKFLGLIIWPSHRHDYIDSLYRFLLPYFTLSFYLSLMNVCIVVPLHVHL